MNPHLEAIVFEQTGASDISSKKLIQELWSGYGQILKIGLLNSKYESIIVKHINLPEVSNHPRGWGTDYGHQRKLKSYKVEEHWYQTYSKRSKARIPQFIASAEIDNQKIILLEDLDISGYHIRKISVGWNEVKNCLQWLAKFHASYMQSETLGLWAIGTYWHLDTRPQELSVLQDKRLKKAAKAIDHKLNSCKYMTVVHGDAKLANFCFSPQGDIAGLDFQYVGGGCGMKDVAYLIGSCFREKECERLESEILDTYFSYLQNELDEPNNELEEEWRHMYRVAWADFHRFLKGWSPGHWKVNSYSEKVTNDVIDRL